MQLHQSAAAVHLQEPCSQNNFMVGTDRRELPRRFLPQHAKASQTWVPETSREPASESGSWEKKEVLQLLELATRGDMHREPVV
jgi:hypothetical protein